MAASSTPNGTIIHGFGFVVCSMAQRYAAAQKTVKWKPGRTAAAANIDLISARVHELRRDVAEVVYITHRDRAADGVAVGTGSRVADGFAVAMDEFTAPEDGFGIFQHEDRQPPPDA